MAQEEQPGKWRCRLDRVWCYAPAMVLWLVIAVLLGLSLLRFEEGDLRRIKPRQVLDGILIWFCLGPVLVGVVRGWRNTLRRRLRAWSAQSSTR